MGTANDEIDDRLEIMKEFIVVRIKITAVTRVNYSVI